MVVSIVLDSEYMGMEARIKWFMKNLSHALENDYLIITHECLKKHYEELVQNCEERFYTEFEMRHISKDELEKIDICYIPDSFFENLYRKSGTRTKMIVDLSTKRDYQLEGYIQEAIENALQKRQDAKVDYIMNCLHCFKSITMIGEYYNCPVIPYVFSAIRKVHGYQQTLYMANMSSDLFNNDEIKQLYKEFNPKKLDFELLSNKEIIALIGKKRNIPLIPLLELEGVYELGIAAEGWKIIPQSYCINSVTDDDIYYEARHYYTEEQIVTRLHPFVLKQSGIGRSHMKNDPASFILSCKRVVTTQSQLVSKAILWNRVPCTVSKALPYSFLLSDSLKSYKKLTIEDTNFLFFCYFIPDSCMFSNKYWMWRIQKPSANDIYIRHIKEIFKNLGYDYNIIFEKTSRFSSFLQKRNFGPKFVAELNRGKMKEKVDYAYLSSKITIQYSDGGIEDFWCLNHKQHELFISRFIINEKKEIDKFTFFPLDDVDGFAQVISIEVDQTKLSNNFVKDYVYFHKGLSKIEIYMHNKKYGLIEIRWKALSTDEYLRIINKY